jgi:hypothetical protein
MKKFCKALGHDPGRTQVKTLYKKMQYQGEAHLFSMWACLFADPGFTRVSAEELVQASGKMWMEAKKFRKREGIWPHPAVLYKMVVKKTLRKME